MMLSLLLTGKDYFSISACKVSKFPANIGNFFRKNASLNDF